MRGLAVGHGLHLATVGGALGAAAFIPASRLPETQVYGVSTADPFSMAVAAGLAMSAAAAASAGPPSAPRARPL